MATAVVPRAGLYISVPVGSGRNLSFDVVRVKDEQLLVRAAISALEDSMREVETEKNERMREIQTQQLLYLRKKLRATVPGLEAA